MLKKTNLPLKRTEWKSLCWQYEWVFQPPTHQYEHCILGLSELMQSLLRLCLTEHATSMPELAISVRCKLLLPWIHQLCDCPSVRDLYSQGSHKYLKTEFHGIFMTDLLLSMTPVLTWFQAWLWLCLTTCMTITIWKAAIAMRTSNSMTFPWHPATFHDFLGNFKAFPWEQFFPGFPWLWEPC